MADKKLDKTTLSIIAIAVIVIAIAILIWLSQRKAGVDIINGGGNGGIINGDEEPPSGLIRQGTPYYMRITQPDGYIKCEGYNHNWGRPAMIFQVNPAYVHSTLEMYYNNNVINQIQYDSAMAQLANLGY